MSPRASLIDSEIPFSAGNRHDKLVEITCPEDIKAAYLISKGLEKEIDRSIDLDSDDAFSNNELDSFIKIIKNCEEYQKYVSEWDTVENAHKNAGAQQNNCGAKLASILDLVEHCKKNDRYLLLLGN